ncbi:MAG: hypothetical protein AAFQ75_09080, partial [Pseudomonadota bacterium]
MPDPINIDDYERVVFHFDGNNNDPDDIAAIAVAALLAKAAGIEDKTVFYFGNNLAENNQNSQLAKLRDSAAFAESLGIEIVDYQADIPAATASLTSIFNSGDAVLVLDGGPMEATYRALEGTSASNLGNITQVSHSAWNENRDVINRPGVTEARTWDDIADDFPAVEQIEIRDQNNGNNNDKGFNNSAWTWMDESDDPVIQAARDVMIPAGNTKRNDPSDAGMLYWALTGDENGTPQKAEDFILNGEPLGDDSGDGGDGGGGDGGGDDPLDATDFTVAIVDTATDTVITTLENGDTIDFALVEDRPTSLAVIDAPGTVGSMQLSMGGRTQTENVSPYALFGDTNGNYKGEADLGEGSFILDLTA